MINIREASERLGIAYDNLRKRTTIEFVQTDKGLMIPKEVFNALQQEEVFKKSSVTLTQAEQISGISKKKLCNYLKEGEEWRLLGNKIYVNKEALERLLKEREPFKVFVENSVNLTQAERISGMNPQTIRKYLKKDEDWIDFDGKIYVKREALERLIKERGLTLLPEPIIESSDDDLTGYTPLKEFCDKTGIPYVNVKDRLRLDLHKEAKKVGNRLYLKNEIIPYLIEEYNFIKNSYRRSDLIKLLDVTSELLSSVLEVIKQDVEFKQVRTLHYFNKDMINQKIAEYGGGKQYYEACKARTFGSPDMLEINGDTFIAVNSIQNFYNFKVNETVLNSRMLRRAIQRGTITNTYQNEAKQLYASKKELDSIEDTLKHSISIPELLADLNKINNTKRSCGDGVLRLCPNDVEVFNFDIFGQRHYRIKTQNPKQFKADFIKRAKEELEYRNTKKPHDRYQWLEKELTSEQKKQFGFTIKSYKKFVFTKLNTSNSNALLNLAHEMFRSLQRVINVISVEVYLLSDDEIVDLLSSNQLTGTDRIHLPAYLNYLRREYPGKCSFKNQYNRYREIKLREVDDIYTLEQWCAYSHFLTDINKHIEKAFERYAYAKRWLYAILHFSVAWRSEDFLETPALDFLDNDENTGFDFLDIDNYSLDWFKNNDFKLSDGQIIINSVKRFVEDRETRKTGARKHFIVPIHYVLPVSIAIIIAEYHRRKEQGTTLFSINKIEPKSLRDYLGEEMAGFSSLKANRSLISYIFNEASETEGYVSIAYSLASYARSHKPNMYQKAETTTQYIYALNTDGDINTISGQLFRRGVFGWLYKVMIELAYEKKYETLTEMTNAIETLQKELSANGIENISRYMTYELENQRSVINELLTAPKDKLKELINELILGNLTSKERSIYCIKPNNCPFPTQNSCNGCRYSIPTNYSLLAIGDELLVLLEKLSLLQDDDVIDRQKYTFQIMRLIAVLNQANLEFDRIDPDYFKTFIPVKQIRDRMKEMQHKFLSL